MTDETDSQLLLAYAERHSEPAFRELVRRHLDLVHSAAVRMVGDAHLAQDVSQGVFIALAKNAGQLTDRTVLAGWLHRTAQNIAAQTVRTDVRRRVREQEAATMNELLAAPDASWDEIAPHLDTALGELSEPDRDALLLRYFQKKSAAEMAGILGVSAEAAQKRVNRAVERLREIFAKRKITVGAGGLAVVISANAVQAAPVGLALTISGASLAAAGTTLTFMKIVAATKLKLTFGAIVVVGVAAAFLFQHQNQARLRGDNELLQQQIAQLQTDNANLSNRMTAIGEAGQLSAAQFNELLKLRGKVGVLQSQLDEVAQKNRALQIASVAGTGLYTNSPALQIHIKARFLTMPNDVLAGLGGSTRFDGILTSENASNVLREVVSRNGVEILAEPEVTTTSGRQFEMRATQLINVVTNFTLQESNNISSIIPQTGTVETGPILNSMPRVLSDGYTIELPVVASVTDFLGYAQSTNTTPAYNSAGQEIDVPTVSPQFRVQSTTNSVNLFDDQTLVFGLKDNQDQTDAALAERDGGKSNSLNRHTLVFVTATIIDPAGNRVHEDASYTNIPPQPISQ